MRLFPALLVICSCAAASNLPASPSGVTPESITVTSRSFSRGGAIPIEHTCDGGDTSPDVTWSSPPEGTKALVLTFDDTDTAGAATRWIVMNINPEARSLKAGADPSTVGGKLARNDKGQVGYTGPCPARHEGHHYTLRVIALDSPLKLDEAADREAVNAAMEGHVLGSGDLVGTVFR
jgi:Raf kinase inhibitor-like YbhB/YbcL family protein